MEYRRSPFRDTKQTNYELSRTPRKTFVRKEEVSFNQEKQNSHGERSSNLCSKRQESNFRHALLQRNSKHITSQMINEFENDFSEKYNRSHSQHKFCEGDQQSNKSKHEQAKKYNAKHMEIECKLNKIQSYHNKIQTLLQMVNHRPKTPKKASDLSVNLTPRKTHYQREQSTGISRSVSKISGRPVKFQMEEKQPTQKQHIRQYKYGVQGQSHIYKRSEERIQNNHFRNTTNENKETTRVSKFQHLQQNSKDNRNGKITQKRHQDRDFRGRIQSQKTESGRKKSKEYMRSIQGQVREIQNTIELLNKKIKQVDNISFKKQIAFDNLTTSNPQSFSQIQQKLQCPDNGSSQPPIRQNLQTSFRPSPSQHHKQQQDRYNETIQDRNSDASQIKSEYNFRKDTTDTSAPQKYQIPQRFTRTEHREQNFDKIRAENAYQGDVEQSEERNRRYSLVEQIRKRRN